MCSVNGAVGREQTSGIKPAQKSKRVFVIGSGPAGMEAARMAALRGHEVTLFEKRGQIGGQLLEAVIPPHKDNIKPFLEYLRTQMAKRGVYVRLGIEATARLVSESKTNAVILATGVKKAGPRIKGIDGVGARTATEVLNGATVGDRVVIIGGGLVGCETAEFLAERKKDVTVIELLDEVAGAMPLALRKMLLARMAVMKVTILTGVQCQEICNSGVVVPTTDGREKTIPFDTLVIATGGQSDQSLLKDLDEVRAEAYLAGDCVEPRGIAKAVADGLRIGLQI